MGQAAQKYVRSLTVMLTAGGSLEDVLEMAKAFGVRAVHVDQLAVPIEEEVARQRLLQVLKRH